MRMIVSLLFLASITATCHGSNHGVTYQIYPLRMKSGSGGHCIPRITCPSWRLGVEAHNIINWKTVPEECADYVGNYTLSHHYREDSRAVTEEAFLYADSINLNGDGKDIWIFDIDETTLSNLPFYAQYEFGAKPVNGTAFLEWISLGVAPALPESLELYKKLLQLDIKVVFLTGRPDDKTDATARNLKYVGYHKWEKLILRNSSFYGNSSLIFKSAQRQELVANGYRIIGNMGDQWSDILGNNTGDRTFKLPNPMYYVS